MGLFKSKKFLMSLAGVVAVVGNYFLGLPEDKIIQILALIISYIIGQGLADFGKSAAEIEAGK